ncbi:MAG: SOS response-associated peptidase [Blautia sp.]|nr:SOS response-associated peptidase [Blautia sp.]
MCSRYYVELSPELRPYVEAARHSPLAARMVNHLGRPAAREGEIRPTDIAAVIAPDSQGRRSVFPMVWGFSLSDFENTKRSQPLINARIETADQKPTWKESFLRRRCAVPASYYFEWQRLRTPDGKQKPGDKYAVQASGAESIYMAGIYRLEDGYPHFTILTREPGEALRKLHDRMPVLLEPRNIDQWIDPISTPETIKRIASKAITSVILERV